MPSEYQNATARPASLEEETRTVIEEARMVLPGIQAFFGFQLIAVFNTGFQELTHTEQVLHLIALLLLAVSIALIMTPAAYHRIAERGMVSRRFVALASRFLECAMFPLMPQHYARSFPAYSIDSEKLGIKRRCRSCCDHDVLWPVVSFPMDSIKARQTSSRERSWSLKVERNMNNKDPHLLSNLSAYGEDGPVHAVVESPKIQLDPVGCLTGRGLW